MAGVTWTPGGEWLATYLSDIRALSFTKRAIGGHWEAQLTLAVSRGEFEDWIADGLGRHVEINGDAMECVWEGFVNRVEGNAGGLAITRGPLLDMANRVMVKYREKDASVDPPVLGGDAETAIAENMESQDRYGVFEQVVSGGELDETTLGEATQLRDTFLAENAWPPTSKTWTAGSGGGSGPTITLYCLGYVHMLDVFVYEDTMASGSETASDKMALVLDAEALVNGLFDSANGYIDANGTLVAKYEDDNTSGWDVIQDILEMGGPTNERWLFMVGPNRQVSYEAAPTEIEYYQHVYDSDMRVTTPTGDAVEPWSVEPGKWLLFSDFLTGVPTGIGTDPDVLERDIRTLFIEEVAFSAPHALSLRGNMHDTVAGRIAQMTMTNRITG